MARDLNRILASAAMDAFEQLGFLLADPEAGTPTGAVRGMRVRFTGPTRGALEVRGDETLLRVLAMSMLGRDDAPELPLQLDALGEIANVICGNVLPRAEDPVSDFRLSAPEPVGAAEPAAGPVQGSATLGFEGGVARVDWVEATQ